MNIREHEYHVRRRVRLLQCLQVTHRTSYLGKHQYEGASLWVLPRAKRIGVVLHGIVGTVGTIWQ